MKPPHNVTYLERMLRRLVDSNENGVRLRTQMANAIVGQFLDGAVMRGGGALKMRYGNAATRFTMDFDAARNITSEEFEARFTQRLKEGWNGFSGRLVEKPKARPRNVPAEYVMQPYEVKLTYRNHAWCTVALEVSYNEIGDADECDLVEVDDGLKRVFLELGFPVPAPVPLMRIAHQVAQKLHGVTEPRSVRAQDLLDLQLIHSREHVDFQEIRHICQRLFANRNTHAWPPTVQASESMRIAYDIGKEGLDVLQSFDEAVVWANDLIARIDAAK